MQTQRCSARSSSRLFTITRTTFETTSRRLPDRQPVARRGDRVERRYTSTALPPDDCPHVRPFSRFVSIRIHLPLNIPAPVLAGSISLRSPATTTSEGLPVLAIATL